MSAASLTLPSIAGLGFPAHLQAEGHVLAHRHVRVERVVLEHHRDVAILRRQVVHHAPADDDLAAGNLLEAGDHPQQRGLPAPGGADQNDELAIVDVEGRRVQDLRGAERLVDATNLDGCHEAMAAYQAHRLPVAGSARTLRIYCQGTRRQLTAINNLAVGSIGGVTESVTSRAAGTGCGPPHRSTGRRGATRRSDFRSVGLDDDLDHAVATTDKRVEPLGESLERERVRDEILHLRSGPRPASG